METIEYESAEYIRRSIPEGIWNNPELGKHYIEWRTEDGHCGLTINFRNKQFDIIIKPHSFNDADKHK